MHKEETKKLQTHPEFTQGSSPRGVEQSAAEGTLGPGSPWRPCGQQSLATALSPVSELAVKASVTQGAGQDPMSRPALSPLCEAEASPCSLDAIPAVRDGE